MNSKLILHVQASGILITVVDIELFVFSSSGQPDACSWNGSCARSYQDRGACSLADGQAAQVYQIFHVAVTVTVTVTLSVLSHP